MKRAVLFDLDGTLVDTPRGIAGTIAAALESLGEPARDAVFVRATIGMPLERAFELLLGAAPGDARIGRAVARYQALFKELVLPHARELVFEGVPEGLAALKKAGCALAVATSKHYASADALLAAAGLRAAFDEVVGADQVSRPKPDPEIGRLVLARLGVEPARSIMVGDTEHDVLMAKAAGMRSVAVTYGVHPLTRLAAARPTWIAASFGEAIGSILGRVAA